jgi:hypothetical protein
VEEDHRARALWVQGAGMSDTNVKKAKKRDGCDDHEKICEPSDLIGYEGRPSPDTCGISYDAIEHVTDKAVLISMDGSKKWVPKSQIVDADEENLVVTEWWAVKNEVPFASLIPDNIIADFKIANFH